jgi:hypothetical protein
MKNPLTPAISSAQRFSIPAVSHSGGGGAPRLSTGLSSLLKSKAKLSVEMALRIEKAFGVKMDTLTRMQAS